jgi:hypothetical protein
MNGQKFKEMADQFLTDSLVAGRTWSDDSYGSIHLGERGTVVIDWRGPSFLNGNEHEVRINWSAIGAQSVEGTIQFMHLMGLAVAFAGLVEDNLEES